MWHATNSNKLIILLEHSSNQSIHWHLFLAFVLIFSVFMGLAIKDDYTCKAHSSMDGSRCDAPWLQEATKTYAFCIDQALLFCCCCPSEIL